MEKQVNIFMVSENNGALSSQNEMKEKNEGLAWSNVSKPHAPIIHNSDTLVDSTYDAGFGIPLIELSSSQKDSLNAPWKYSLIAKVLGRGIALQFCQVLLHRLWSLEGTVGIIDLGYGFFLLKFSLPADYNKVFKGIPWMIHGKNIYLRPWVPDFKPSEFIITDAKVWVRLPELPIEYYDKKVLFRIGAAIGTPVKIDPITEKQERGRFARLCVEVDLSRSLLTQIKLGELRQMIEYEGHIEELHQYHSPNSIISHYSSLTKCSEQNPLRVSSASQNVASNNRNTSTNATWFHVPASKNKCLQETKRDSGSPSPNAPGLASSGSRFSILKVENHLDPAAELKPSKGKSEYASPRTSSTNNEKNIGFNNNGVGQKECPKAGEGKSLPATETFGPAKNVQLAATKLPMPDEALTGHVGASVEPTVSSRQHKPKSVKLPQDSLKQLQKPCTSSLPLSSTLSSYEGIASPFSKDLKPGQDNEVYRPLPAPYCTTSTPTELGSLQHSNLVMKNASCLGLYKPQPPKQSAIPHISPMVDASAQFYSKAMQRSTKYREIKSVPALFQSTESSPTVFSIDSTISDIEIGMSISPLSTGNANLHSISFTPSQTNHNMHPPPKGLEGKHQSISKATPESLPRKLLSWNCRGAGDFKFMQAVKDLVQLHKPSIVVLLEPKISGGDADKVINKIGFSGRYSVDPEGFAHGIWILWCTEDVHVEVTSSAPNQIHFSVEVLSEAFNKMLCDVGVDDNLEPAEIPRPWGPSFFFTPGNLMHPPTSEWVPFSKEVEVGQISSWA